MAISTRLTQRLGITHPIISAPMDVIAGGKLAAAVTGAGGLGFLGGGYSDDGDWFAREFAAAGNQAVGCGFITWALRQHPRVLDAVIDRKPKAIFLSFDDPEPFASRIKAAGIPVFCQLQTRADAERAIDCGADVIVAQGTEGGGHGGTRATLTLVPEIADLIAKRAPQTLLCAAGGIADGRGLGGGAHARARTGSWSARGSGRRKEALVHPNLHAAALAAGGDDTVRQSVLDIVRGRPWPARYTGRVLANDLVREWFGREAELREARDEQVARYGAAAKAGDASVAATIVGEAVGLIQTIEPAAAIVERIASEAEALLKGGAKLVR